MRKVCFDRMIMTRNIALVVTGASRGLGREIAKAFVVDDPSSSSSSSSSAALLFTVKHISLLARSVEGLHRTKLDLLQQQQHLSSSLCSSSSSTDEETTQQQQQQQPHHHPHAPNHPPSASSGETGDFSVAIHVVDLSLLDTLDECLDQLIQSIEEEQDSCSKKFNEIVLVNNAGSLGPIGRCIDVPSLVELRKAVDLNVTSSLWMSVRLARFAVERHMRATIINISSLVAQEPFPTLGIYSAGKAARESFHAAMAQENDVKTCTYDVKCLNYAPGPLETDMANEIRSSSSKLDPRLRPNYKRQLVEPKESARALVKLIRDMNFDNGAHIDYYDVA